MATNESNDERSVAREDAIKCRSWRQKKDSSHVSFLPDFNFAKISSFFSFYLRRKQVKKYWQNIVNITGIGFKAEIYRKQHN